jgi:hypothetical protein
MNEPAPDNGIPRGALIVVAIGLIACVVAAVASTSKGEGEATQLEWVQKKPIADSGPVPVPGGKGQQMQIVEAGLRATGTNASGYSLYRSTATLKIDAGAPIGSARILCSMKAPGRTEVAQTPKSRASYPRSSEELTEQDVPEVVLVEFSSHGNELAVLEFEDLFADGFSTEKGIKVEWPAYKIGDERWEWFLPPGPPKRSLELPFATVWKTTAVPAAEIGCTLTTSAGKAAVQTQGALPERSEPIAEEEE